MEIPTFRSDRQVDQPDFCRAVAFNGVAAVNKGKAGVDRAAKELIAAGNKVVGRNITIKTVSGKSIVADLVVQATDGKTLVIVEVKNGASVGFTANQIMTGLAEGANISGEIRGIGSAPSSLRVGQILEDTASFVIRYIH